jgi:cytoskeleton protein RodZ
VSVGAYLHDLRASRGISLEELAHVTRVSPRYLQALETEQFQELPAPVFTKGFIRAYCQALGHSPDEALRRYGEETGQPVARSHMAVPARSPVRKPRNRGPVVVSLALFVVLGGALFILTRALRDGPPPSAPGRETRDAPSMEPPAQSPATPPPTGTTALRPSPPPPSAESPSGSGGGARSIAAPSPVVTPPKVTAPYRLVARATQKTWVRVQTEDGKALAEEVIPAGETREWASSRRFVLTVGNAGGIALELNGEPLPQLGSSGAVVRGVVIPPDRP